MNFDENKNNVLRITNRDGGGKAVSKSRRKRKNKTKRKRKKSSKCKYRADYK